MRYYETLRLHRVQYKAENGTTGLHRGITSLGYELSVYRAYIAEEQWHLKARPRSAVPGCPLSFVAANTNECENAFAIS